MFVPQIVGEPLPSAPDIENISSTQSPTLGPIMLEKSINKFSKNNILLLQELVVMYYASKKGSLPVICFWNHDTYYWLW